MRKDLAQVIEHVHDDEIEILENPGREPRTVAN